MSHCNMRDLFKKAEVINLMVMAGALKTISHCGNSSKTITTLFNNSNIVFLSHFFHSVISRSQMVKRLKTKLVPKK